MRLAIYAHYSKNTDVALHTFHFLKEIRLLGFELCFVSNSPLSQESQEKLGAFSQKIIQRENTGLDFSMWKDGLAEYDLTQVQELLLANSSVIGPLAPLSRLWQHPIVGECDFWGLTDSNELWDWHLQSFFVVFKQNVVTSRIFSQFWSAMLPYHTKGQIIRSYEIGLTVWLQENGFRWQAMYKLGDIYGRRSRFEKIRDRIRSYINPVRNSTLFYPDFLVRDGMPFVKKSLLGIGNYRLSQSETMALLKTPYFPTEALMELQNAYPINSINRDKSLS
jgi:lipopolysaccharide biosynthesis protein